MATLSDIGLAAGINILTALVFLIAFGILRLQPYNDMVYHPKWYLNGLRNSPRRSGVHKNKFVNLDWKSYIRFLNWIPDTLKMPEEELIEHAGLDSAVYLRIYVLGLKIFVPMTLFSWAVLVPVNWTNKVLARSQAERIRYSNIDELSISNIPFGSYRFWAHMIMAYAFTFWTCFILGKEYAKVAAMRRQFLVSESRRPDKYTVLVRNVPPEADESVSECVEHFFMVNHPDHYLTHQVVINANKLAKLVKERRSKENRLNYYQLKYVKEPLNRPLTKIGFRGLWGKKVDAIDYQTAEIERLSIEIIKERERVITDPKCIMPVAFVSFKSRWGAAVCAQTMQYSTPTQWLTEWASEPRDIYWANLAIPYVSLTVRRLITAIAFFSLTFFFVIPVTFVQSLANIQSIERVVPFLKPLIETPVIRSLIQGVLPGIALKLFLLVLPSILMVISKFEGFLSISVLERRSAMRYYIFNFINVFLVSVIAGTALEQLDTFISQPPNKIYVTVGVAIPMRATFFITYVMVDGWASIAAELLRLIPLILFHMKNSMLVKTETDRKKAMDPGSIMFHWSEPRIQLYFLLGLVYSVVTPVFLPFILVFFAFAYVVYCHQIINVYNQKYESTASFWPVVHGRIIFALVFSHITLIGLMTTKGRASSTPFLVVLPVLTLFFHRYCKGRYQPAFVKYPLQEAMKKDTLEQASSEASINLKAYLEYAYIHPVFKNDDDDDDYEFSEKLDEEIGMVATTRQNRRNTPVTSKISGASSPPSLPGEIIVEVLDS